VWRQYRKQNNRKGREGGDIQRQSDTGDKIGDAADLIGKVERQDGHQKSIGMRSSPKKISEGFMGRGHFANASEDHKPSSVPQLALRHGHLSRSRLAT